MCIKEFHVNNYITLKLNGEVTNIYIKGKIFIQCKNLVVRRLFSEDAEDFVENFKSIDEEVQDFIANYKSREEISPEVEFFVHCSNIQAWVDNKYNTTLLHSKLAFPLLKELTYEGDKGASLVFKEEIAKRFLLNYAGVSNYLIAESYLDFLDDEEFWQLISTDLKDEDEKYALKDIFEKSFRRIYPRHKITSLFTNVPYFKLKFGRVIKLNLSEWCLKEIPTSINKFTHLKELDLSLNVIKELPNTIGDLKFLEILDLSFNPIEILPDSVKKLKTLAIKLER